MLRSPLFWRLYAGYVVVILISTFIVGILFSEQIENSSIREIHHSLAVSSELLAEVAKPTLEHVSQSSSESPYQASLQERIVFLGKNTQARLTAIDLSGKVIADSQEDPRKMDNHSTRPEIIIARQNGSKTESRFSKTLQQKMIYRALAVRDGERLIGFVRVSLPLTNIDEKLVQLKLNMFLGICLAAAAALLLGFVFANRFLSPLVKMTEVADSISKGDYNRRVTVNQNDEMGLLAKAVNRMALSSSQRMAEITQDRNRLAKIFTGMVEGVIYVDQDQRIQHINQAAADMLFLTIPNCLNQRIWELVRIQELTSAVETALSRGEVVKSKLSKIEGSDVSNFNGAEINIYVAAMLGNQEQSIGAVVVLNDVSELAHLERIRRDFVSNASHELKTPITAIRVLTETILDDVNMPAEISRRFTEKIAAQSHRLSALVSDLMTISRLEISESEDAFQLIDYKALVKRSIKTAALSCQEKNLLLRSEICQGSVQVNGDEQGLSQLLDNLLDNAVKYTPEHGAISLDLSLDDLNGEPHVIVKVSDTGIGINAQNQARIFERFYRVDKARTRDLGGTGLGLSIVKNIAEQHGGSVSVKSRLGGGSTFTVTLPLGV